MGRGLPTGADGSRRATVDDIHEIARGLPGVTLGGARVTDGRTGPTPYQIGRRSFLFFRTPRPDAVDLVEGAWLSRAGPRAVARWMKDHRPSDHAERA